MLILGRCLQSIKRPILCRGMLRLLAGSAFGAVFFLCASTAFAAEAAAEHPVMKQIPLSQIFTFFMLMLGPIKIIGPFAKITQGADPSLSRKIAFKAMIYSCIGLLFAALLGEQLLSKWGVPLPVLAVAGGVILFLVALQTVLQQYGSPAPGNSAATAPTLKMAMAPLAFPTIVTPHGIAALIIFLALSPDMRGKLIVAGILLIVMVVNLLAMLFARHVLRFMGVVLQLLGSVLGVLQIALGLQIIVHNFQILLK